MPQYFKQQGFSVGKITAKVYQMMGAVDGFGIEVQGQQIELYLFDPATASQETLDQLKDAETIGKFSFSGISVPVVKNGNIILTRFDDHPEKDRILAAFRSFR